VVVLLLVQGCGQQQPAAQYDTVPWFLMVDVSTTQANMAADDCDPQRRLACKLWAVCCSLMLHVARECVEVSAPALQLSLAGHVYITDTVG